MGGPIPFLVMVAMVPWALSVVAALIQWRVQARLQTDPARLDRPAVDWLRSALDRWKLGVGVEVHEDGFDGYYPAVDCIGLSYETAASAHPLQRVVAAHEVGHAINVRVLGDRAWILPLARTLAAWVGLGFVAALLTGALYQSAWLVAAAGLCAVAGAVVHGIVVADEALASRRALRLLGRDPKMRVHRGMARSSMGAALSIYGAAFFGRVLLVLGWPWIQAAAMTGEPPVVPDQLNVPAAWLLVAMVPVFALHFTWVLRQLWRPEPVQSGFRLAMTAQRDGQWDFLTGFGVLLLILGMHDHASGPLFEASVALAAIPALPTAAMVLQLVVLVPLWLGWRVLGPDDTRPDWLTGLGVRDDDGPRALMSLYSNPPWYLRGSWVLRLAYVPMVVLLIGAMASW